MWFLELPTDIYHKELLMFNYDIDKKNTQDYSILLSEAVDRALLIAAKSCCKLLFGTLEHLDKSSTSFRKCWTNVAVLIITWGCVMGPGGQLCRGSLHLERPRCRCRGGIRTLLRVIFPPFLLLLLRPSSHLPPLPFSPQDKQHHPWLSPEASLLEKRDKFLSLSPLPI